MGRKKGYKHSADTRNKISSSVRKHQVIKSMDAPVDGSQYADNILEDEVKEDKRTSIVVLPDDGKFAGIRHTFGSTFTATQTLANPDILYRKSKTMAARAKLDLLNRTCIEQRTYGSVQRDHVINSTDMEDPIQQQVIQELDMMLRFLPNLQKFKFSLVSEGMWYGKELNTIKYEWMPFFGKLSGPDGDGVIAWVPTSFEPVQGDKIAFTPDGQIGIRVNFLNDEHINEDLIVNGREGRVQLLSEEQRATSIFYQHQVMDGEYEDERSSGSRYGIGIRHWIANYTELRNQILRWWIDAMEKYGSPIMIFKYPSGNDDARQAAINAAKNYKSSTATAMVIPVNTEPGVRETTGIEIIHPETGGITMMKDVLNDYFDAQICKFIIGSTLLQQAETIGIGSEGISGLAASAYWIRVQYDAKNLAESMTRMVRTMFEYNYPSLFRTFDVWVDIPIEAKDPEKLMKAVKLGSEVGIKFSEKQVQKELGLSPPQKDEKETIKTEELSSVED